MAAVRSAKEKNNADGVSKLAINLRKEFVLGLVKAQSPGA